MKKSKKLLIVFIIILSMVAFETIMYKLAAILSSEPYTLSSKLDNAIPFVPGFIYAYVLWYVMIIGVPFILYLKNKTSFYKYTVSLFITIIVGFVIFLAFPTTVARPSIEVQGITLWLVNTIYLLDTPSLCCLPSMHCVLCFLMIIYTCTTKEFRVIQKVIITFLSLLIVASTMLIKQHVIIDAILALIITLATVYIVGKFKLHETMQEKIENKLS